MSPRKLIIGVVVLVIVVSAGIGLAAIILDGTPGGPIVVITPEPDPMGNATPDVDTVYRTRWEFGCAASLVKAQPTKMNGITWRYAEWAGVEKIVVTRHSTGEADAHKISMKIDGKPVEVEYVNNDDVPTWTFETKRRRGKLFTSTPEWPEDMIGVITDVYVDGAPVPTADLVEIRIRYNKFLLYDDCPN